MAKTISPLVVIVGETASGKSDLAMLLAQQFNGEIISADSRAIYRGMDIGTAKPSRLDQAKIKHHLIDIINPDERYSALQFKADALKAIDDIASRRKLPILVGGTGLYVDSVIFDYQFEGDKNIRSKVNPRHALPSKHIKQLKKMRDNTLVIGILRSRDELDIRIEQRISTMINDGLIDEVSRLADKYGTDIEPMTGIGYKTFVKYLRGGIGINQAKEEFIRGDKLLAKRQRTWFKRNKSIHWINEQSQAVELVTTLLK